MGPVRWSGHHLVCRRVTYAFSRLGDAYATLVTVRLSPALPGPPAPLSIDLRGEFVAWAGPTRIEVRPIEETGWAARPDRPLQVEAMLPWVDCAPSDADEPEYAGYYLRFGAGDRFSLSVSSGATPRFLGTPLRRSEALEAHDLTINVPRLALATLGATVHEPEQRGLSIDRKKVRIVADELVTLEKDLSVLGVADLKGEEARVHGTLKVGVDG